MVVGELEADQHRGSHAATVVYHDYRFANWWCNVASGSQFPGIESLWPIHLPHTGIAEGSGQFDRTRLNLTISRTGRGLGSLYETSRQAHHSR